MNYSVKALSPVCLEVRMKYNKNSVFKFHLSSDHHIDNPHCKRSLLKKHLDIAKVQGAGMFFFGDTFCAMQGKYDPRGQKNDVLPEHNEGAYFTQLMETTSEFYRPYAKNIIMISEGNHESSVRRRNEVDLLQGLITLLQYKESTKIQYGRYSGYVKFVFEHESGGGIRSKVLYFHHGSGGGGPVTKGVIQTNRKAVFLPDANIVASAHIHERWEMTIPRERLKANGETYIEYQTHLQLPTYKEEYLKHKDFHIERGRPPKPLGSAMIEFYFEGSNLKFRNYWMD